jgi:hypothetical protein
VVLRRLGPRPLLHLLLPRVTTPIAVPVGIHSILTPINAILTYSAPPLWAHGVRLLGWPCRWSDLPGYVPGENRLHLVGDIRDYFGDNRDRYNPVRETVTTLYGGVGINPNTNGP